MQTVMISDITMKQAAGSSDFSLTFKEKLEIPKLLDRLGVSVIELEEISQPKVDSLRVKSIAMSVRDSIVAVPVQLSKESVEMTWNALREAKRPRLQVSVPVSSVQMEYLFHKKPDDMIDAIAETIKYCAEHDAQVEFLAGDATRSDPEFLCRAINTAIEAGAGIITICDAAGAMLPNEFGAFIDKIYEKAPALKNVTLGVSCSDALAMADACAITAIWHGVGEIKAAAYPVDTVSLPNLAHIIAVKGGACGVKCDVRTTEMKRIINQIAWMCRTDRAKTSPFDNGVQEDDGETLTSHDDMAAVTKAVEKLGYDLSPEDLTKVWEEFCRIAGRKDEVSSKELDAIVASTAMQVPPTYKLTSYVINAGNTIGATAHIKMTKGDEPLEGIYVGDGPIDASFLAIEQIVGHHYELDDFQIQAVTEGREAMGETVVKLRSGGKLYSGRGISTDIIGASILSYINALNKIVYEEEEA